MLQRPNRAKAKSGISRVSRLFFVPRAFKMRTQKTRKRDLEFANDRLRTLAATQTKGKKR